jgi:hypothetical protein
VVRNSYRSRVNNYFIYIILWLLIVIYVVLLLSPRDSKNLHEAMVPDQVESISATEVMVVEAAAESNDSDICVPQSFNYNSIPIHLIRNGR